MPAPSLTIAPGAHIELRDAVWRVVRIDPTSTGGQAWRCVGVSEIVRDQEAIFLEDYEPKVRVLDPRQTTLVRDDSSQHRAGLLYMESLLRDVPPPNDALYIGHKAAMDALPFQLEPAWRALGKLRQRILIADAVGLGKTLEAGILLSELIRRGRAKRILVAATKSMLTQFQKELWARFSIPLVRLDSVGLQRIRSQIPSHHNPFYAFDKSIISIDTLKQNNWFRTHVEQAHWDVIVIDEAHNVAVRGHNKSMRARVANTLAGSCDHLILLSATPHDGKPESFASLMNMLDPTAIADPSDYTKEDISGLYVRRFKHQVRDQLSGHIPERQIMPVHAASSAAEELAYDLLTSLRLPQLDAASSGGVLFKTGLMKALFSSPAACLAQLRAPLKRKRIADALTPELRRRLGEVSTSEALAICAEHLAPDAVAADLFALRDLAVAVEAITPDRFNKYHKLCSVLTDTMRWKPKRSDRLVVFTERRETLQFLASQLAQDLELDPGQIEVLHGGLSDVDQQRIVEDFGKEGAAVRLLVASDVASEGLNLHYLCHRMVHFDVPWSLMVFQQRNGRVDRYGQTNAPEIVYLLTDARNDTIRGDTRILEVLIQKDEQAQRNIGDPSAFMGVYDVEEEERLTAIAMQAGLSPDAFEEQLDDGLVDPFSLVYEQGAMGATDDVVPTAALPSLFDSDFSFVAAGLERLGETHGVRATIDRANQRIELSWPADLKRRFRRLPAEIRPKDGIVPLTADPQVMQRMLAEARREENAWPQHHLLWANSPVVSWLQDRLRGVFGRHRAPVLTVPVLAPHQQTVVVSGVLTNRRGQPLVHRWYAVSFSSRDRPTVEGFAAFQERTGFGVGPLPNTGEEIPLEPLQALIVVAVDRVEQAMRNEREDFQRRMASELDAELSRLSTLRDRKLGYVEALYRDRRGAEHEQAQQRRRVSEVFARHEAWVKEAMTAGSEPFLQVVAVVVGAA